LKSEKALGMDGIVKEHIIFSHPAIIVYLTLLFNIMALHCCVPDCFGVCIIIPIVKTD